MGVTLRRAHTLPRSFDKDSPAAPPPLKRRRTLLEPTHADPARHTAAVPPPALTTDAAPPQVLVTLASRCALLGAHRSRRPGQLELLSDGTMGLDFVVEAPVAGASSGGWARGTILRGDVEACSVVRKGGTVVVIIKLLRCTGALCLCLDTSVDDKSTIVVDVNATGDTTAEKVQQFHKTCKRMFAPVPWQVSAMLVCKLRLLSSASDTKRTKQKLNAFRGDTQTLQALGTPILLRHLSVVVASLASISDRIDAFWETTLAPHLCIVCSELPAVTLLLPCRHLVLCASCMDKMKAASNFVVCPVCRSDVEEHTRVFSPCLEDS